MRRLRKYLALSLPERAIVLRSLLLLPMAAARLRAQGMARTTAWLGRLRPRVAHTAGTLSPQEVARLVNAAASVVRARCLARSLVLSHLLRNRGIPNEIQLGVSKSADGKLDAHAWVELDGVPLIDGADVSALYAPLPAGATQFRVDRS